MKSYFSHDIDARLDLKMVKLRHKLGLAGVGAYWCICERLCGSDGYRCVTDYDGIAIELGTDETFIKHVIEDFGLFVIEDGMFYSRSMCERMAIKDEKAKVLSDAGRRGAMKRWGNNREAIATPITPNSPYIAPNGNKIKENKIKENTTIVVSNTRTRDEEFFDVILNERSWHEAVCMARHISMEQMTGYFDEFRAECRIKAISHKDADDVKRHFCDWLKYQQKHGRRKTQEDEPEPISIDML